jgi:hypothetical protein
MSENGNSRSKMLVLGATASASCPEEEEILASSTDESFVAQKYCHYKSRITCEDLTNPHLCCCCCCCCRCKHSMQNWRFCGHLEK